MISFFTLEYFRDDGDRRSGLQNIAQKAISQESMSEIHIKCQLFATATIGEESTKVIRLVSAFISCLSP